MSEVLIVVQARFASRRLPGKALYPLAGMPLVAFLLRRLKCGLPPQEYHIVLATTTNPEDDIVAAWGRQEQVDVFRGADADVLARYLGCLERFPAGAVVRVTGDNPLTAPEFIMQLAEAQQRHGLDYAMTVDCPYGTGADIFSAQALSRLGRVALRPQEREHINMYVLEHKDRFTMRTFGAASRLARPGLRMTIDTVEDWQRLSALFKPEEAAPWSMGLEEAIARLDTGAL